MSARLGSTGPHAGREAKLEFFWIVCDLEHSLHFVGLGEATVAMHDMMSGSCVRLCGEFLELQFSVQVASAKSRQLHHNPECPNTSTFPLAAPTKCSHVFPNRTTRTQTFLDRPLLLLLLLLPLRRPLPPPPPPPPPPRRSARNPQANLRGMKLEGKAQKQTRSQWFRLVDFGAQRRAMPSKLDWTDQWKWGGAETLATMMYHRYTRNASRHARLEPSSWEGGHSRFLLKR